MKAKGRTAEQTDQRVARRRTDPEGVTPDKIFFKEIKEIYYNAS
jgi:hypothetical protein